MLNYLRMLNILSLLPLIFCSCNRQTLSPVPAFCHVREKVEARTGYSISYPHSTHDHYTVNQLIEDLLSQELTLDVIIQVCLANNKRLRAEFEDLGIAQAELIQAGLLKNPIFDFSAKYDHGFSSGRIIEMGIIQNFLDILLIPLKKKVAASRLEIVKNKITGSVIELITDAKVTFYSLQAAEQILLLKKQFQESTEITFEVKKRLQNAGNETSLAVIGECFLSEQSKIDVAEVGLEVIHLREKLNVLMGLKGAQIAWSIPPRFEKIPKDELEFIEIENCAAFQSLDLMNLRREISMTAAKNGIDKAEVVYQEIGLGALSDREVDGNWFVGPQFTIGVPLFDFGNAKNAVGRAELRKLWNLCAALEIDLRSKARAMSFKLSNTKRQALFYEEVLLPLGEQVVEETMLQFNAMQISVIDLVAAKQREIEAKIKAISSYKKYFVAKAELDALINGHMGKERIIE